ncbi:MAG: tetratricopeptide repeat protein [Deltaproteobacteria bacterium]
MSSDDKEDESNEPSMTPYRGSGEGSDMFRVEFVRKSIPAIREVPLTREEVQRRKAIRVAIAVSAVVALIALALVANRVRHRASIAALATEAERTGRISAIDAALGELAGEDSPADVALRARLLATAVLAGETARRADAESLLALHELGTENASDHRIASTYLALAAGDAEAARNHASALVAGQGPRAAEAGHARALTALAIGNIEAARSAADAALAEAPDAPRHQALVLEVGSRQTGTLELTEGEATILRIARARARWERDLGRSEALLDAQAVLAAPDATPSERAWAELLLALSEVVQGDTLGATEALARAEQAAPPGDELFEIEVTEAWLALGRLDAAERTMTRLGTGVSTDAGRRGLLYARRALANGDVETAQRMAALADESARRTLVEADIAAQRGDVEVAIARYRRAAENPDLAIEAMCGLSGLLVLVGRAAAALAPVEPLLARDPTFPRVAAAAAYALAAQGDRARALSTLGAALEAHPREPALLAAQGRVHFRSGQWQSALEAYRRAMEVDDHDAEVATERGIAARRLSATEAADREALVEEARASLARAIELVPAHRPALLELLDLSNETGDVARGEAAVAGLDAASIEGHEVDLLRARHLVIALAGSAGVDSVRAACERRPDDGELRVRLGQLHYQAEQWNEAADAFYAASTRQTPLRHFALAMRALAFGRARREPSIEPAIDMLRVGTSTDPLTNTEEAYAVLARAWMEWHNEAYGRASIFARQALEQDATNAEAMLLLGHVEALQRRDATERMRAAAVTSLEATGWMALHTEGEARCEGLRRYLRGAPSGRYAAEASRSLAGCPG